MMHRQNEPYGNARRDSSASNKMRSSVWKKAFCAAGACLVIGACSPQKTEERAGNMPNAATQTPENKCERKQRKEGNLLTYLTGKCVVREGDYIMKLEEPGKPKKETVFVKRIGADGIVIATNPPDLFGNIFFENCKVRYGETKAFPGGYTVSAERGAQPGTAIVEMRTD